MDVTPRRDKRPVSPEPQAVPLGPMAMRKVGWAVLFVLLVSGLALAREARGPIRILSDLEFTRENGVIGGSGTPEDPYVIAGWKIEVTDAAFAIQIRGVTRPFVIRDVEILGSRVAGIKIETTRNGRIEDVFIKGAPTGIMISLSRDIWIERVKLMECTDAIRLLFSQALRFGSLWIEDARVGIWFTGTTGTELRDSYLSAELGVLLEVGSKDNLFVGNGFFCRAAVRSEGGNIWYKGERGNYWDGFSAPDEDGDGIADVPYRIYIDEVDRFPLSVFAFPKLNWDP